MPVKRYKSFKELANWIEGTLYQGYQVVEAALAVGEKKTFNIEGTDIIVPCECNKKKTPNFVFEIAINNGDQSNDWLHQCCLETFDIKNFPFYKFSIRNTHDEPIIIVVYVFTNPRYVMQLNEGSNG